MSYTKKDLERAFNEGRLLDEKDFDSWLEQAFPNDKANKILEIKRMIQNNFDGSTSTYELEADSSPCISSAGTNKMNVSTLVERFNYDDVQIVTYNNETEIASDNLSYEELSEDIVDEIYHLLENKIVDNEKTWKRCQN